MGNRTRGFTIIEVMLFLGVTGILTIGILVGTGVAIGQQRYRDAVTTFKTSLQEGYNQTANTQNDRSGSESCSNGVIVSPPDTVTNPQPRGTSECLIMGKMLQITASGKELTSRDIIGFRTSQAAEIEMTDLAELSKNYSLSTSAVSETTTALEWGATAVKPKTSTPYPLTIAIIRSPLSSTTMTFVKQGVTSDIDAMVASGIVKEPTDICLDPDGGAFAGQRLAVRIVAFAGSQSGVEIPAESDNICD